MPERFAYLSRYVRYLAEPPMFKALSNFFSGKASESAEADFPRVSTPEALEAVHQASYEAPVILFKHSRTCGISSAARRRMVALAPSSPAPIHEVVVQAERAISNQISENYAVHHQSPQLIVLHQGAAVYDTSHSQITEDNVRSAFASIETP